MEIPILMPQLGESIAEATIVRLNVGVGDAVEADQEVIEVETNKAVCYDCHGVHDIKEADDPIFSVTYLSGTIVDGGLTGRWTAPGPSSTNGVLMWPEVMKYFTDEAQRIMKGESG